MAAKQTTSALLRWITRCLQSWVHAGPWLAIWMAATSLVACASAPETRPSQQSLYLDLVRSDGSRFDTASLVGQPLLLFFFTTYDSASQFAFIALETLSHERRGELHMVGVALQPQPEELLQMYSQTLSISLPLAYEPSRSLLRGATVLGELGGIPQYVLLAADGRVLRRHEGVLEHAELSEFVDLDE